MLSDAAAIARWEASRTANAWGPNWAHSAGYPAPSTGTLCTQSDQPQTDLGTPAYMLSNRRGIVLFDRFGRLRGFTDRAYGMEWIRRNGALTVDPDAKIGLTWLVLVSDATDPKTAADVRFGISTAPTPTLRCFTTARGDQGLRVSHAHSSGVTFLADYELVTELDLPTLKIHPHTLGARTRPADGKGFVSAAMLFPGLTYAGGGQDVYVPAASDGVSRKDVEAVGEEVNGRYPSAGWWAKWFGFMTDRSHGVYFGWEDTTGTRPSSFFFRPFAQTTYGVGIHFEPMDGYGVPTNTVDTVDPLVIRPFCSEAGYAALAKQYRAFAIQQSWSHPARAMKDRTDGFAASDLAFAIGGGAGDPGNAGSVRVMRCAGGTDPGTACTPYASPSACTGGGACTTPCTGTGCNKLNSPDTWHDELGNVRAYLSYYVWGNPRCPAPSLSYCNSNAGKFGLAQPLITPQPNLQSAVTQLLADFPTYKLFLYFNPHATDLSALFTVGNRCNGRNASETHGSLHDDPDMVLGAVKSPNYDLGGSCSVATQDPYCRFENVFLTSDGNCLAEGSPAYPAYAARVRAEVDEMLAQTKGAHGIYLDTVPLASAGRFDPSDRLRGELPSSLQAERDQLRAIGAKIDAGAYGLTREYCSDYVNSVVPNCMNWNPVTYDAVKHHLVRVPLLALAWHDWMNAGDIAIVPGDDPVSTRVRLTQALVYGVHPLLTPLSDGATDGSRPLPGHYQAESRRGPTDGVFETTVRRFATARRTLAQYLVEGELLAPAELSTAAASDVETLTTGWCNGDPYGNTCSSRVGVGDRIPSVWAAWWRGSDGSYALIYANANASSARTAYVVPLPRFRDATPDDCGSGEKPGSCSGGALRIEALDRWKLTPGAGSVRYASLIQAPR